VPAIHLRYPQQGVGVEYQVQPAVIGAGSGAEDARRVRHDVRQRRAVSSLTARPLTPPVAPGDAGDVLVLGISAGLWLTGATKERRWSN